MKNFTKSVLVAIAMMAGATTANAQDNGWMDPEQWVPITSDMWHEWKDPDQDRCTAKAEITGSMTPVWFVDSPVEQGACVIGSDPVGWNQFVDISEYDKLIILGTSTQQTRVCFNREINEGAWKCLWATLSADDSHWNADIEGLVIDLSEVKTMPCQANNDIDSEGVKTGDVRVDDYVHFICIKNWWNGGTTTISGMYLWKAGGQTAIKTVKSETAAEDGVYYNLQGQRVDNPTKGLFIHNGKKVILK